MAVTDQCRSNPARQKQGGEHENWPTTLKLTPDHN